MPLDALNVSDFPAKDKNKDDSWWSKTPMAMIGDERLSHACLRVLLAMTGFADKETGENCFAPTLKIADAAKVSPAKVIACWRGWVTS
jgi:hypothetical protein